MVPTGTGNHGKMEKGILLKILQNLYWKIEKNTGKVREICQSKKVRTMINMCDSCSSFGNEYTSHYLFICSYEA